MVGDPSVRLSAILATLPSGLQEISGLFNEALAATYGPAELAQIGASSLPHCLLRIDPAAPG